MGKIIMESVPYIFIGGGGLSAVRVLETFEAFGGSTTALKTDIAENTSYHASIDGIRSIPTLMLGDTSGEFPVFFDTSFEQQ
ncbi:hypothetical protein [Lyngbya sp. CCY1209]|uniref:hypothetical protein n=1 Tax=Lyngbya sp. CCY1209 TaxID=2886103 RepID=UPI002D206684|nr:hypothetical protein [Lyngbya sp. CCY1209]MEB3882014.1 hypothetical protein [Lyngbya sp. CCY1209]